MPVHISKSVLQGKLQIPPSKSYSQRALVCAALRAGTTLLHGIGNSNDEQAVIQVLQQLGVSIQPHDNGLLIEAGIQTNQQKSILVNVNESGLACRMLTPVLSCLYHDVTITGEGSLLKRDMQDWHSILPELGLTVSSQQGKLPIHITGTFTPKSLLVDGSKSSQYITGLLLAYSAAHAHHASITVQHQVSKPYIDMTLQVMNAFGLNTPVVQGDTYTFQSNSITQSNPNLTYTIEADWSGASYWLAAGALHGNIQLTGLNLQSLQADAALYTWMSQTWHNIAVHDGALHIHKANITGFSFDATHCPDLFPALVLLAAFATGKSTITGVHRLANKESNRAIALQQEFGKMGVHIYFEGDDMCIEPPAKLMAAHFNAHNDHRIAMSLLIASTGIEETSVLNEVDCISKSYPTFLQHFTQLGGHVLPSPIN